MNSATRTGFQGKTRDVPRLIDKGSRSKSGKVHTRYVTRIADVRNARTLQEVRNAK